MINRFIIFLLIIILLFTFVSAEPIHENFVDYMMPDPTMIKNTMAPSDADQLLVLSEAFNAVKNHEIVLASIDPQYTASIVKQDSLMDINANIQSLYPVLRKQDAAIKASMRGDYIPSKTLDNLENGSLVQQLSTDLTKIMNYKAPPLIPREETNPAVLYRQADAYDADARRTRDGDLKKDLQQKARDKRMAAIKIKNEGAPTNMQVDDAPRITAAQITARVEMARLAYLLKFIEYQDNAINILKTRAENYVKSSWDVMN